jgi:hypothetical protein
MNCPMCLGPMAWSEDRGRLWCAVYGDHRGENPDAPRRPGPLMLRADAEYHGTPGRFALVRRIA